MDDDANVPSLLAMSYLGYEPESQEVADNTKADLKRGKERSTIIPEHKLSGIGDPTHRSATYGTSPKPSRD